ncbi:hypothetical protein WA026_009283 [Henosepilachna vigintioctopunctata]|uniref:Uncharacterized protein n=1 Tax=Henosepilachna vigintioctopunctata TaxID=420089 RepID=A0AAW1UVD7_9CUCU
MKFVFISDNTDVYTKYLEDEVPPRSHLGDSQPQENREIFYPSFPSYQNQPSGHSRPFYGRQETAYSQRPQPAFEQRFDYDSAKYAGYKDVPREEASEQLSVLGSGNFGVIKGGTFYQQKEASENSNFDDEFDSFYQNGHGRPSYYYNPNPRPYQHEQFANFRDFADINTPSYSEYIVVYANKNDTSDTPLPKLPKKRPNNIFDSLAQLDLLPDENNEKTTVPPKKLSISKRKLGLLPREKKTTLKKTEIIKQKAQNEAAEPLLALS